MTVSVFGPDRICAVIAAPTSAEAVRQLRSAMGLRGRSRVLELRLDYLRDSGECTALLRWVSRRLARQQSHRLSYQLAHRLSEDDARSASARARMPTILAACRTRRGGGQFAGSIKEEVEILAQAARAGCLWCDVEIETAKRFVPAELHAALAPARILVSAHDFRRLPPRLSALREKLFRCGGDAVKIAAACRSLADTRRLLEVVGERGDVIAIPMADKSAAGDAAAPRILALREGAALAYAAVERTTAPGQLSLEATKRVYRLNRVFAGNASHVAPHPNRDSPAHRVLGPSRDTRVYGVIGDPVAHSLSPLLHNTAFAARGIDAVYLPFHVQELPRGNPRNLRDFLAAVKNFGISGFSVTLPHKQSILRYLDDCEPLAASIGAVNTVVVRDGRLSGYNTDYVGVLRSIESRVSLPASRVLLLGAGGAARAAAFALARGGAFVSIWARRRTQARALARAVGGQAIERSALRSESFDAVVNCTPVGMHSATPRAPGTSTRASARNTFGGSPLEPGELNCRVVMDLIYRPRKTELLYRAERRGIESISGVEMFLAQGIAQWEIWTGERAPRAAMRRAVIRALADEERVSQRPVDRTPDRPVDHITDHHHHSRRNSGPHITGRRGGRRFVPAKPPATV